jgi:hypothetical protein
MWIVLALLLGVAVTGALLQLQAAGPGEATVAGKQQRFTSASLPDQNFRNVLIPGTGGSNEIDILKARQQYFLNRYTYPIGYYDATWLQNGYKQAEQLQEGIPAGRITYSRANSKSPLALDPNAMVALGPMPGQTNNCDGCYHAGQVSGRINSVTVDPVVTTTVYLGVSNGGVWKTTNCCSAATTWVPTTDDATISTISIDEVSIDPSNHNTLYAATGDFRPVGGVRGSQGILKSTNAGATWTVLGASVFGPNRLDPDPQTFEPYTAVSAVKVDPNNSNTLIAGTKTGLRMSYDGGVNWTALCSTNAFAAQRQDNTEIVIRDDGATSTIFYAVGWPFYDLNGANGIYTATMPASGCPTWNLITRGNNGWPTNTGSGVAGTSKPGRIDIAIAPSNPQIMYAGVSDAFYYDILGIWRSTNGGATWSLRADYLKFRECNGGAAGSASYGQAFYDQAITVDPNNPDALYYGEVDAFRSTDGGAFWQNVGCVYSGPPSAFGQQAYIHPDQHDFRYVPGASNQVLLANDGGIWFTNNANVLSPTLPTITSLNATMNTFEFYNGDLTGNFATGAQPGANGGAQDNGSYVNTWTSPGALAAEEWQLRVGGDGFFAAIEPVNNLIYYQSQNDSSLYRSTTGGYGTYTDVSGNSAANPWLNDGRAFAMPFEIYKHDCPNTGCTHLIAGTYRVWETTNGAVNSAGWYINSPALTKTTPVNGWSKDPNILQLSYSPSLSTTAIVGTSDGNVQYGFNLGQGVANSATWVNVTDSNAVLPNRPILDVTIDPLTPTLGYAALGAFDESTPGKPGHVYQVTCTALCASRTWVNKSGNLPNLPADAIIVNPKYRQQVFVGTDSGLYYTNNIDAVSPVWVRFTAGLPNVSIADLTVDRGFTTLAVWTHNRGLYAWPLPSSPIVENTPTSTSTSTRTATATATATRTATRTNTPLATSTSTNTVIPPTSTSTSTGTLTPPTSASTSTSTSTAVATSTSTVIPPTSTGTAIGGATATSTVCTIQFVDAGPSTPFYNYIRCLACRNVLGGYSGATNCPGGSPCFRPNDNITRGQIAKIVSNAAGYADAIPGSQQSFADVPSSSPFWVFIERVHDHGAISGYPCGGPGELCPGTYYRPGANLTRGQLAKIATSVAGYNETPSGQTFNDVPPSQPFYAYIERAVLHNIISGYPCGAPSEPCPGAYFRPGVNVTRGQAAKIIAGTFFPGCVTPARE